jgi:drug/metabolite transporter (DMT)-like permease
MYCGLLTTDLALLLEVLALQNVSSVDAAIIYTLEPVTGAGLAWLVLGERLGPLGLAGAGIILASSVASQLLGGELAPPAVAAALASASDVEGSMDAELLPAKSKSKKSE